MIADCIVAVDGHTRSVGVCRENVLIRMSGIVGIVNDRSDGRTGRADVVQGGKKHKTTKLIKTLYLNHFSHPLRSSHEREYANPFLY